MAEQQQGRKNVVEDFPLYDTCQIRTGATAVEGYVDFLTLAGLDEIPFFTVRNRSEVGYAYTNKESKDSMPFAYGIHSVGVQFICPGVLAPVVNTKGQIAITEDQAAIQWFNRALLLHVGAVLRIREDDKLINTVELLPAGSGVFGVAGLPDVQSDIVSNGWPDLRNRFPFAPAIDVPRGAVLQVSLRFSRYARGVLALMTAGVPGFIDGDGNGKIDFAAQSYNCALIRVSCFGKRAVQQRGELAV